MLKQLELMTHLLCQLYKCQIRMMFPVAVIRQQDKVPPIPQNACFILLPTLLLS